MVLVLKSRVGKKNVLYIPKAIVEALNLREGTIVRLIVRDGVLIVEPIPDPFDLALNAPKYTKIKFEEFEKESEEMQNELFREVQSTA